MAAVGDVYIIKQKQISGGQDILNQYFYEMTTVGDADGANELFNTFDDDVLSLLIDCVQDDMKTLALEIFNIQFPTEFREALPDNNTGTRVATAATRVPTYLAFSYRSNRNGPGTRRSYKRFAGLLEADIDTNVLSSSFLAIPEVDTLRNILGLALTGSGGGVWRQVQVKSDWVAGFAPTVNFNTGSWQDPVLTSQVSRKP